MVIELKTTNCFNFERFASGHYLITNDLGRFVLLSEEEFQWFVKGDSMRNSELSAKLINNYFVFTENRELFINKCAEVLRKRRNFLFCGTQLHIFVVTTKCNQRCLYCQASANTDLMDPTDMDIETSERAVDIALQSSATNLTIEFQGGEPLLNFNVVKHIVNYSEAKAKDLGKTISYTMVSNLNNLSQDVIQFLIEKRINISTSIDGPAVVHDFNRPNVDGTPTLDRVAANINRIRSFQSDNGIETYISAIQTTTGASLGYPKEIIDQYIEMGFTRIFLRPLTPLGFARKSWGTVGYEPEEFLEFYASALNYLIELALQGIQISEVQTNYFLKKILEDDSCNYMELRSPCGGAFGQLAYNVDGNVYTCDEGRMVEQVGDHSFRIGNVNTNTYKDLIENPVSRTVCVSSCLETLPGCTDCVYNPYCGVCPILDYGESGTVFGQRPSSYKCKINKGILRLLFSKILYANSSVNRVLQQWANCV